MGFDPFYFGGLVQWNMQLFVFLNFTVKHDYVCHHESWYINQQITELVSGSFFFPDQQHCWIVSDTPNTMKPMIRFFSFRNHEILGPESEPRNAGLSTTHHFVAVKSMKQESCTSGAATPASSTLSTSWESFALTCMHVHVYGLSVFSLFNGNFEVL